MKKPLKNDDEIPGRYWAKPVAYKIHHKYDGSSATQSAIQQVSLAVEA